MAEPSDKQKQAGAFNRAATGLRLWFYNKKYGPDETRRAEMLARVEALPGGADLLKTAADLGIPIRVLPKKEVGADGSLSRGENYAVSVANNGNPAAMALTLWHELRHVLQNADNPEAGMPLGGDLKNARTSHMLALMQEADAFTAETLVAVQQRRAGNPEYYNILLEGKGEGPFAFIARFLRNRPPENFKDDAAFARALFTDLMCDGLLAYRAQFFARYLHEFKRADTLEAFRNRLDEVKAGGTHTGPELKALYGSGFMSSTSARALATAFWQAQPEDERQAVEMVGRTMRRAHRLTEAEFRAARDEIIQRTQELYFKDPEEAQFKSPDVLKAEKRLKQSAAADKPLPLKH